MKVVCSIALAFAALSSTPALADGCDPLIAALVKGVHTPWHSTMTSTRYGVLDKSSVEVMTVDGRYYTRSGGGNWGSRPLNPETTEARVRKDWAHSTCKPDGTEAVGGEMADILLHHSGGGGVSIDARFWISQSTGLILKTETKQQMIVITSLYDYRDIKAPAP